MKTKRRDMPHAAIAEKPESAASNLINYAGLAGFFAALFACRAWGIEGTSAVLLTLSGYAVPILLLEAVFLRTPWNISTGLGGKNNFDFWRVYTKLIGVYGSYGFVAFFYWLFPEYHGDYYRPYWAYLKSLLPWALILAVPYVVFMDMRAREPRDGYWHFGMLLRLKSKNPPWRMLAQHLMGWIVKGFFLPLMLVGFANNVNILMHASWMERAASFEGFYRLGIDIMFTVDLLAAVAGYTLSIRLFDTHIRSSEPTLLGWFICVMCYQPFLSIFMNLYLSYGSNNWMNWLEDPLYRRIWGLTALSLVTVYSLCSVNFGCRFSNLTHRGILTNGPYRFTKHPAYISKNLFWWMVHVPFVPALGWLEALRFSLLLLAVNAIYYLRARTEEAHLSRDPVYVRYALWMNDHGMFRFLACILPFLKYKAPEGWEKLPPYQGIQERRL